MTMKQRQRKCVECGEAIPPERVEALPETFTCVRCSGTRKKGPDEVETAQSCDPDDARSSATGTAWA